MPINTRGNLWIYCVNVGQGDTTVVVTPMGKVLIFDAVRHQKIIQLISDLNLQTNEPIEQIVVSHPHNDHYSGVVGLLNKYDKVVGLTLSSIRHALPPNPGYNDIVNTALTKNIPIHFQCGYGQLYPDQNPLENPDTMYVELLGPSNQFIENLHQSKKLNTNHYSIIARLNWKRFRMVIAADAQMENWAHFDNEQMLSDSCTVLRAAHHGSANGTQYERVDRLNPRLIVVSSDPNGKDNIPDLIGSAILSRFANSASKPIVAITDNRDASKNGTIKIEVQSNGSFDVFKFEDQKNQNIDLNNQKPLNFNNNPTDWKALTRLKLPP